MNYLILHGGLTSPSNPLDLWPPSLQPRPSSPASRPTWRPTSAPRWPCCASPEVTPSRRSPGGGRTGSRCSTGRVQRAPSRGAGGVCMSAVSLLGKHFAREILLNHAAINIPCSLSDLWVDDEAVYVCEAHNHFGRIQAQASISVTGLGNDFFTSPSCSEQSITGIQAGTVRSASNSTWVCVCVCQCVCVSLYTWV